MLAVTNASLQQHSPIPITLESVEGALPAGLHASFCYALETTMELLHYFLTTYAKSDKMTISSHCTAVEFAEYVAPCLSKELLRSGNGLHARASRLKPPCLAAYERPVVVVSAFAGDALTTRASSDVVFGNPQYVQRCQQLLTHVRAYIETVRQYLRSAFTYAMLTCLEAWPDACRLLARTTPRAVVEIRRRFLSRRVLPSEAADPAWSCLGNVLLFELLKRPVVLTTPAQEHGELVGLILSGYLRDKHVVRYLAPLPSDVYFWSGPFSASGAVELFTTPSRCLELIAELYDVKTDELDIAQYMAIPDAAGMVCPTAIVARLMAGKYKTPVGIQTRTMLRLKGQRGKTMAAVETCSELLQGLKRGLHCAQGVFHDDMLVDMSDVLTTALRDIVSTVMQVCRVTTEGYTSHVGPPIFNNDGGIDLFPTFMSTVAMGVKHGDASETQPWVRPCFADLPVLHDADMVTVCCADRHEYHASVLPLLGLDAVCDCRHKKWSELPLAAVKAGFDANARAVFLCGLRLPTLNLHNLHEATPQRCEVMALLANVATQASVYAFQLVQASLSGHGRCRNGHASCLATVLGRVVDFAGAVDDIFACSSCGESYDEQELVPFFTASHVMILTARRARLQGRAVDAVTVTATSVLQYGCAVCSTPQSCVPSGGVGVCTICSDVTCLICKQHAHPGIVCCESVI